MKPLDWILVIIFLPYFLITCIGRINASNHPLVKAGLATPHAKAWQAWASLAVLCFVAWRVWG